VAARAGVAQSAFDEVFESAEDCYLAAFEEGLELLSHAVADASQREQAWLGRLRSGLVALLGFLDDEPQWANLLLLGAPMAGPAALRCEQRVLGVLTQLLDDGSPQALGELTPSPQMTAELVAGGAFAVIRARMSTRGHATRMGARGGEKDGTRGAGTDGEDGKRGAANDAKDGTDRGDREESSESLVELAPSLMSFIVRPYLGEAVARAELSGRIAPLESSARSAALPIRATHRTTLVLRAIGAAPGSTNRQVADAAGLVDDGQASKLLARLQRHGLIENVGVGASRGEPNAWLLTPYGHRALELLGERAPRRSESAARRAGGRIGGMA
jgi:AcrR family transcriptional regulator